jgi:hypothetical protein
MRRKPKAPHEFLGKQVRTPTLKRGSNYSRSWNHHLIKLGLRWILESQRRAEGAGTPFRLPAAEALIEYFDEIVRDKAIINGGYDDIRRRGAPRFNQIEHLTSSAAEFVLVHYDDSKLATWAAWGRKSRRTLSITPGQVGRLSYLSKAAQAKALGCSAAHIAKLRRIVNKRKNALEAKQQREANRSAAIDALLAPLNMNSLWLMVIPRHLSPLQCSASHRDHSSTHEQARDAARTTTDLSTSRLGSNRGQPKVRTWQPAHPSSSHQRSRPVIHGHLPLRGT